jgi:pyruvate,water dikinase
MRRILRRVAPLSLVDPQAANFVAQRCKTAHDMIRFIHEKAVQELTDLPRFLTRSKEMKIWSLASAIPLDLKILDLGGGVDPGTKGKKLSEDQIRSHPLRALWSGISSPGVWSTEPVPVDFKGMMASLTKTQTEAPGSPSYSGLNLAVVGDAYMNLHLHLGYHFNLIDARAESDASRNHIYFRFVGGVTEITRRSRRAQLLSAILSSCHFTVRTKGDLVVAQITQLAREEVLNLLEILGCLIGYTRQLDIRLRSDQDVPRYVQAFLDQHVSGDPVPGKRRKA